MPEPQYDRDLDAWFVIFKRRPIRHPQKYWFNTYLEACQFITTLD